jgi:hypothetical protein
MRWVFNKNSIFNILGDIFAAVFFQIDDNEDGIVYNKWSSTILSMARSLYQRKWC